MALSTLDQYIALVNSTPKLNAYVPYISSAVNYWYLKSGGSGISATPTAHDRSSTFNALKTETQGVVTSSLYVAHCEVEHSVNFEAVMLTDLLWTQGGFSLTSLAAQTVNSPAAALPRYTSGEGVMIMYQTVVQANTTAPIFTVSYTNQAGVSGKNTQPATSSLGAGNSGQILVLADGDTGVQSIQSITLSVAASAGTALLYLFKPLITFPAFLRIGPGYRDSLLGGGGGLVKVENNACLMPIMLNSIAGSVNAASCCLTLIPVA